MAVSGHSERKCRFCNDLNPTSSIAAAEDFYTLLGTHATVDNSQSANGCIRCSIVEQALSYLDPGWKASGRATNFILRALTDTVELEYREANGDTIDRLELFISQGTTPFPHFS
jgi:hypothetical protein